MPKLFEEQSCSHLRFVVDKGTTEPIRVDQLRRVREPVSRSKSGVQGKVADVFHGRSRHAESQNEFKAFRILLATARADAWQEQPFKLEYHHEGAKHRYTPDILVIWGRISKSSRSRKMPRRSYPKIRRVLRSSADCWPNMVTISRSGRNPRFARSHGSPMPVSYCGIAAL